MTETSPDLRHANLVRAIRKAAAGQAPRGTYNPVHADRAVALGADHTSAVARMVSFHETFHAFLNASTSFGCGMILAGALQDTGEPLFDDLIGRMIESAIVSHETYATVAALYVAGEGQFSPALLEQYPAYRQYFDAFAEAIDVTVQPFIGSICVDACARAAMQTDLLARWLELPCDAWAAYPIPPMSQPDTRLRALLAAGPMGLAAEAVRRVAAYSAGPLNELLDPSLEPKSVLRILTGLPGAEQESLQRAAFSAFAATLDAEGMGRPGFDDHQTLLPAIVVKAQARWQGRFRFGFDLQSSTDDAGDAVLSDFRSERLLLRAEPDDAVFAHVSELDASQKQLFLLDPGPEPYLFLVALPARKALALYRPRRGADFLSDRGDGMITGLRRRITRTSSNLPLVEFLCVDEPDDVEAIALDIPGVRIHALVSATTLYDAAWRATWLTPGRGRVDGLAVLIDFDPFELVAMIGNGAHLKIGKLRLNAGEDGLPNRLEVLVITSSANPAVVYFTPATGPLIDAVAAFGRRRLPNVSVETDFLAQCFELLRFPLSHVVREEFQFGFGFWTRGTST